MKKFIIVFLMTSVLLTGCINEKYSGKDDNAGADLQEEKEIVDYSNMSLEEIVNSDEWYSEDYGDETYYLYSYAPNNTAISYMIDYDDTVELSYYFPLTDGNIVDNSDEDLKNRYWVYTMEVYEKSPEYNISIFDTSDSDFHSLNIVKNSNIYYENVPTFEEELNKYNLLNTYLQTLKPLGLENNNLSAYNDASEKYYTEVEAESLQTNYEEALIWAKDEEEIQQIENIMSSQELSNGDKLEEISELR